MFVVCYDDIFSYQTEISWFGNVEKWNYRFILQILRSVQKVNTNVRVANVSMQIMYVMASLTVQVQMMKLHAKYLLQVSKSRNWHRSSHWKKLFDIWVASPEKFLSTFHLSFFNCLTFLSMLSYPSFWHLLFSYI